MPSVPGDLGVKGQVCAELPQNRSSGEAKAKAVSRMLLAMFTIIL
jgi:hypothetical protein